MNSLDPLQNIIFDELDYIYKHLNGNDAKTMSEVSADWYDFVGYSKLMKKIELQIIAKNSKNGDLITLIEKSGRRYAYVQYECADDVEDLNVHAKVLAMIANDVICLIFGDMNNGLNINGIAFPKLKKLEVGWLASMKALEKVMTSVTCEVLEELRIDSDNSESIIEYLKKHKGVKKLELLGGSQLIFDRKSVKAIENMQLTTLKIGHLSPGMLDSATLKTNILDFLESQSGTLKHLGIDTSDQQILRKALGLPHIKCLELHLRTRIEIENLPVNSNIKAAKITSSVDNTQALLKCLPNLKKLHIEDLTSGMLKMVAEHAMKLDKLFCEQYSNFKYIALCYEELKRSTIQGKVINNSIQLILVNHKFEISV